ncbi:hypothetical protein Pmar_PMAR025745, partial [Perkinsus marinus ATCC 50983]
MSFLKKIIAILGISSMVQCFPPKSEYCTDVNLKLTGSIFFHSWAPDLLQILYFYIEGGRQVGVNVTGTIPWTVDAKSTTLFMDTTNTNFTYFADFMHFNPTEWERIPFNDKLDAFTLSVNGTHIEASSSRCPKGGLTIF